MLRSLEVTLDAVDVPGAVRFWTAALGYAVLRERPPYVVLAPADVRADGPAGPALPRLLVQQVGALPAGHRLHLDLRVDDPAAEADRLRSLGARLVRSVDERAAGGSAWSVLAAPDGTPLCVCPAR